MLFWKKVMKKLGGKLQWFPQLVTVGKPADTQELARRLSAISTVSPGDVHAVIRGLPDVMADILAEGRAVHFDGLGSFYLTCTSKGNGVDSAEEVDPSQINAIKVNFLPDRYRTNGGKMERPLVRVDGEFIEWKGKK